MIDFSESHDPRYLISALNQIAETEIFSILDTEIAKSTLRYVPESIPVEYWNWMIIAVADCHRKMRMGHTCMDLSQPDKELLPFLESWPDSDFWERVFSNLESVEDKTPVVWESPCFLYIRKFWKFEQELTEKIALRSSRTPQGKEESPANPSLEQALYDGCSEDQIRAIQATDNQSLILLSGGPGTGKTFTVLRCLVSILTHAPDAHIALTAPTGKAVARLAASVAQGLQEMELKDNVALCIPDSAQTIHRFLKKMEDNRSGSLVPYPPPVIDWIFIDEVSMVDLHLLRRLFKVIPDSCRVFMLGDIHQLASVEPGSVFSDIYQAIAASEKHSMGLQTIELSETFRFTTESPLFQLCEAVRNGDSQCAQRLLENPLKSDSIRWNSPADNEVNRVLDDWITEYLLETVFYTDPEEALGRLKRSLLLCATNRGPVGVETLNHRIRNRIRGECQKRGVQQYWSPILVTQNDYRTELFNGDIGIQQRSIFTADSPGQVFFEKGEKLHELNSTQLPSHTDAFSLTIHKSQGSEAENVLILLPDADSPVLTRELLYTAISRTKTKLHLIASWKSVEKAIHHPTQRNSRLSDKLHQQLQLSC
jgi:exodeoxyribonuclease V alpha subunit